MTDRRLLIPTALGIWLVIGAAADWPSWAMCLPALATCLFTLGYALLRAGGWWHLGNEMRFQLAVATSFGSVVVVGLLLNLLPSGLSRLNLAVALGLLQAFAALASAFRERGAQPTLLGAAQPKGRLGSTALRLFAAAVVVGLVVAVTVVSQWHWRSEQHFTALSVRADGQNQILEVFNHEGREASYRLSITVFGQASEMQIRVPANAVWRQTVLMTPASSTSSIARPLHVGLYLTGSQNVYRTVDVNKAVTTR